MKRLKVIIMMGLCFTVGTLFGLMVHLPGGSFKVMEEGAAISRQERGINIEGRKLNGLELDPSVLPSPNVHGKILSPKGFQTDSGIIIHRNNRIQNKKNNSVQGNKRISQHSNEKSQRVVSPEDLNIDSQKVGSNNRPVETVKIRPGTGKGHGKVRKPYSSSVILNGENDNVGKIDTPKGASHVVSTPSFSKLSDIVDGIYWTKGVESLLPVGFTEDTVKDWNRLSGHSKVVRMQEGCGRMQNRLLTFKDASKSCARYRINTDQIQGEIFSFYLGRILGIQNIPPSVLKTVNLRDQQWEKIGGDIQTAQWSEDKPLIMTQWVKNLVPAYIPEEFRPDTRSLSPNRTTLLQKTVAQLQELLQWSDLIVFDYLTANLDRVVNNMFNKQWNNQIMEGPTHNLERSTDTGLLVFLDNESGLFHSYRLLDKYAHFHESLLKSLCIYRRSTAQKIKLWHESSDIMEELWTSFQKHEPLHRTLPWFPEKNVKILKSRISDVYNQIRHCERTFGEVGQR